MGKSLSRVDWSVPTVFGWIFILLFRPVALRSIKILCALTPLIASVICSCSLVSFLKKAIGNAPIAVVATVETSTTAHIRNRLAWISIPATKVLVMIFFTSNACFPVTPWMIENTTSPANAKLAKFFMIFHIFHR